MADVTAPWSDVVNGTYPIRLIDNGDGSYSLATSADGGGNPLPSVTGNNGKILFVVSGAAAWKTPGSYQDQPANPTGTTNTTGKMMGLAGAITPAASGRILVIISGDITNNNALGGAKALLKYGTGAAPSNGDAPSGTSLGSQVSLSLVPAANTTEPFTVQGIATGLSVGTAYWVDLDLAAITAGTASVADLSVTIMEF